VVGTAATIICAANFSKALRELRPGAIFSQLVGQRDLQAVGDEGNEDGRFDAVLALMVDRTDG
jgi:hypothetical protein